MALNVHRVNFFNPRPQAIRCLAYDELNSRLAVSRSDSSLEMWNLIGNPFMEKAFQGSSEVSIETLVWCNSQLFSAGLYGKITEHDPATLFPKNQMVVSSGSAIWCMKENSNKCLAIGNEDGHVILYQLSEELNFLKKFNKQEGPVLCLAWHSDNQIIVTGSRDAIRMWNVKNGHVVNRILLSRSSKHTPTIVWCIAITRDLTIVSGDSCGKTSFWDGNNGTLLSATGSKNQDILSLVINKDEDVVYTSGVDPTITSIMKAPSGQWMKSIQRVVHTHDVRALQMAGDLLASGGDDCKLVFTKYPPKTTIKYFPFCQKSRTMCISEPPSIMLQNIDNIEIWSLGKSSLPNEKNSCPVNSLRVKPTRNENIMSSAVSSNGKWLAYSTQFKIRLFSIKIETSSENPPVIQKVNLPKEVPSLANILLFTSDAKKLIINGKENIVIVQCDSMEPTIQATIEKDSDSIGEIHLMDLSSNDDFLACGCHDGNIVIYNMKTLKVFSKLPAYKCQPTSLKFDPASENLIAAYSDRKVIEYNLKKLAYTSWSKQQALLDFQTAAYHPITSICFRSGKLLLQDETTIYTFDKTEEHLEKKRIKRSEDTFDPVSEETFKKIDKYEHISSIHPCGKDLVVVHHPSNLLLDTLPPPVWKKKFGT